MHLVKSHPTALLAVPDEVDVRRTAGALRMPPKVLDPTHREGIVGALQQDHQLIFGVLGA